MTPEIQPVSASVRALCQLSETYGRALCREPQKVEAMLRDLCPHSKREIFLLVSALKEQIVPDLMSTLEGVPEDVVVTRSRRKLSENLGFNDESANWAVDSWLQASRILAGTPDVPFPGLGSVADDISSCGHIQGRQTGLDWIWLALCLAALIASAGAIRTVAWFALSHDITSFRMWLADTAMLTAGLAPAGLIQFFVARQFLKRRVPNHWVTNLNLGAAAMLCEILVILAEPLVPVVAIALWAGEWAGSWHLHGQAHDLTFHLSRILQTIILALFLAQWCLDMIRIQGRLATSAIGRRQ